MAQSTETTEGKAIEKKSKKEMSGKRAMLVMFFFFSLFIFPFFLTKLDASTLVTGNQ